MKKAHQSRSFVFTIFFSMFVIVLALDSYLIASYLRYNFRWYPNQLFMAWLVIWLLSFTYLFGEMLSRVTGFFKLKWLGGVILAWLSIITSLILVGIIPLLLGFRDPVYAELVLASSILLTLWGVINQWRKPIVKRITPYFPFLLEKRPPITLVQLSDIHLNGLKSVHSIKSLVDQINQLEPDVVVFTGDLLDTKVRYVQPHLDYLANIKASVKLAVSGNHDFYSNYDVFKDVIQKAGFDCIDSSVKTFYFDKQDRSLRFVGLPDSDYQRFVGEPLSLKDLLAADSSSFDLTVLLRHRPIEYEQSYPLGVDLQLSGHTHDGQIPPWGLLVRLAFKYHYGLHKVENGYVYTTKGTSTWGPPVRLFGPSEIPFFYL
ncbi:hypothetical protein DID75_03040 [Candidatus Marinamargulisbacteria bacterium SCGC AG-410-N11]|nr:hypothetical protein DID75_03040 [Candidatus Marinamargulisbacteria bacterium SCGC AG-410-N11]